MSSKILWIRGVVLGLLLVACGIPTPNPPTATANPTETMQATATDFVLPSVTSISPTPEQKRIRFLNWQTDFCDDLCGQGSGTIASAIFTLVVPGRNHEALEVIFDLRNSGWVLIKKNITPEDLAGTKGVSFLYNGIGAPNSIELKLLLRYPGDSLDTTFGVLWNRATNTGDEWRSHEALYEVDFRCWGPDDLCKQHGNTFDMESVQRIEFGIANKNGDSPGLGKVTFDELILISE